jgi:hypothetical protein
MAPNELEENANNGSSSETQTITSIKIAITRRICRKSNPEMYGHSEHFFNSIERGKLRT